MQVTASGCYAFLKSYSVSGEFGSGEFELTTLYSPFTTRILLQKGGIPATPSGTATLLRLSPSYRLYPRTLLAVTHFRHFQLPWLDGRCVQGPGTYSPRHC